MTSIFFTVNARSVEVAAHGDTPLLDVLCDHLGLTGTRFGCGLEQCGACMVLIDRVPEKSCGTALSTVAGKCVMTIEGLGTPSDPHPLQQVLPDEAIMGHTRHRSRTTMRSYVRRAKLSRESPAGKLGL
jgi:nicotinate dehydrogenase subunit A